MALVVSDMVIMPEKSIFLALEKACLDGRLDKVKIILKNNETKLDNENKINLNDFNLRALEYAYLNNHIKVGEYLLQSPELKEHINIHTNDDILLRSATEHGAIDIVKYLLTSPNLKEHANLHADNDFCFKVSCERSYQNLIEYFIFDCNIEYTQDIKTYIKNAPEIQQLFDNRELNKKLEEDLTSDIKLKSSFKL